MREKIFGFLIVLFLVASLAPAYYEIANSHRLPPNREFELVHNFPTDFNFYLSRIRQGIEGNITVREQYTSEPHQGSFIHIFYLSLGWIGAWVRVPWHRAADVYHVARIVFGGLLLVMIAEFCKKSFFDDRAEVARSNARVLRSASQDSAAPSAQGSYLPDLPARFLLVIGNWKLVIPASLVAFLLATTASTWPKIVAVINNQVVPATLSNISNWRFGGYMPWWSVMDSLQRITFIPHLLVGQALIIFLVMAISDEATMKKPGNWIFLGIIAFVEGIIFPPGLLFIIVTIGVLSCLELLKDIKTLASQGLALRSWVMKIFVPRAVALGLGLPSLIYLSLMTSFYPWKRLAQFDIIKPLPFDYIEYLKAVGPILPLGLIGLLVALKMKDRRMWPAVAWVIAWALLLFIFKFIPAQSPLRFSEMIPYVPLGVLTAYLFFMMRGGLGESIKYLGRGRIFLAYILNTIPLLLIVLGSGIMFSSHLWQRDFVDHKMRASYPLVPTGSYVMYPLKDFIAAIRFIQDATTRQTVILSETTAGNYIPVYSGNTVYVGHANTVNAEAKEVTVKEFFSGRMKPDDANDWLNRENLHWVFYGPQEKEDGGIGDLVKAYPFLTQAYKNSFVTVYRHP